MPGGLLSQWLVVVEARHSRGNVNWKPGGPQLADYSVVAQASGANKEACEF